MSNLKKYGSLRNKSKESGSPVTRPRRSLSNVSSQFNILKCGWLRKKGDMRYFVLKLSPKPSLHWYKNPEGNERGHIEDLTNYDIFTLGPVNSGATVIFKLVPQTTGKREYVLTAATNHEMNEWIKSLKRSKRKYSELQASKNDIQYAELNPFKYLPRILCYRILYFMNASDYLHLSQVDHFFKELIEQIPAYLNLKSQIQLWTKYLTKGKVWFNENPNKLKQALKQGVPSPIRGNLWMILSNAIHGRTKEPELFEELKQREVPRDIREKIRCDLDRTFPEHPFFRDTAGREKLRTVLEVFSCFNETVGYVQGCGFICGVLLTVLSPENTFWVLMELVNNYSFHGMYMNGFPNLNKLFWVHEQFLKDNMSSLYKHFKSTGISSDMYCTQWFITLFSVSLPMSTVYRIWDIFFVEGWVFVIKVSIALLKLSKEKLLHSSFEEILIMFHKFKEIYDTREQAELLINTAMGLSISQSQFEKYKRQYELDNNTFLS